MQYITIYAVHTYNKRKYHIDNAKLKEIMANCTIMHVSLGSYHSHLAAEGVEL